MYSQDIEAYGVSKGTLLKQRIVAYLAIMLTLLSFVFSCIGLDMARQGKLEKTLYTFSFPYFNQIPKVEPGMVVSLDTKGYVFTGAGTTISLNVTSVPARHFHDVRVAAFTNNVVFAAAEDRLQAYEISYDDIAIDDSEIKLPDVVNEGSIEKRKVESLFKINDETLVVAGSGELLPITIKVIEKGPLNYAIQHKMGKPYKFSKEPKKSWSYCDELHDWNGHDDRRMMACSWEEGEDLYTMVARLSGEGENKTFEEMDRKQYEKARKFHGLAGCGLNGYVVAAVGAMKGDDDHKAGPIRVAYAHINQNGKIEVGNFTEIPFTWSFGFFTLDNVGPNGAVMCYNREASGGIVCRGIDVEHGPQGGILVGSHITVSKGGSSYDYQRTKMQPINMNTFAVMWADQNIGGVLSYQMVTFNNAGDMVKNGPAYVISDRRRQGNVYQHIVGCSSVDFYKSFIVELVQNDSGGVAFLHTVYVYPRPIGIAAKTFAGSNQIQFGGVWKVSDKALALIRDKKLKAGRMYYTNDRGMIIEGPPAGYAHRSFGIQYVTSRSDQSLVALGNRVGMAINEKQLLLKFY